MPANEENRGQPFSLIDFLEIARDMDVFRGEDG